MFKNFDLAKLFDPNRIFQATPGSFFQYYNESIVFFLALFLIAVILRVLATKKKNKVQKKLMRRFAHLLFSFSVFSFLWLFVRWQSVYILSSRFVYLLILIAHLIWLGFILTYFFLKYKNDLEEYEHRQRIRKYIPRPKRKK